MQIQVNEDIHKEIQEVAKLIEGLQEIKNTAQLIRFVTIDEFSKMTGWSIKTVQDIYNRSDFPSCDFGKTKIAEVHAVINYFSEPRRK